MRAKLSPATATAIGSLPHRDAEEAARSAFAATPELPAIPTLPHRSGSEGMLAQAVMGTVGVTVGQYGAISVDGGQVSRDRIRAPDLEQDNFVGMRAFIAEAQRREYAGPVKWQFAGPVTLGVALMRAGVEAELAFEVAGHTIANDLRSIHAYIARRLPGCDQLVVIDEPSLDDARHPSFPLAPDAVADLMSFVLASIEHAAMTGVHCCDEADWATVIAAGPHVLSMPVRDSVIDIAGYIARYIEGGGWVMWGAVATEGPLLGSAERPWRELKRVLGQLVESGCDESLLRGQSMISPVCGLGNHANRVADQVFAITRELSHRLRERSLSGEHSTG